MLQKISPRLFESEPLQRCCLDQCQGACCLYGTWLDRAEADDILAHAHLIAPHLPEHLRQPAAWLDERCEADPHAVSGEVLHTTVLAAHDHYGGTACIFQRPDYKCALQVASVAAGEQPWRFKPFYCILHPLDLDDDGLITLDDTELLLAEPASCLRSSAQVKPLIETFESELTYLLGEKTYQALIDSKK
jgi:hypothetical protein